MFGLIRSYDLFTSLACTSTVLSAGAGVWSLALQALVSSAFTCVALWHFCRRRPRVYCDVSALWQLRSGCGAILGLRSAQLLRTQSDKVLIGLTLGATALGIYSLATGLIEGMRVQLASSQSRVLLAAFSHAQGDIEVLRSQYLAVLRTWTWTVMPGFLAASIFAPVLINAALLEPSWWPVVEPIRILAVCGVSYALSGPCQEVLQAVGRSGVLLRISAVNAMVVGLPATWWMTTRFGLIGAAFALMITFTLQRIVMIFATLDSLQMPGRRVLSVVSPALGMFALLTLGHLAVGADAFLPAQALVFVTAAVWLALRMTRTTVH